MTKSSMELASESSSDSVSSSSSSSSEESLGTHSERTGITFFASSAPGGGGEKYRSTSSYIRNNKSNNKGFRNISTQTTISMCTYFSRLVPVVEVLDVPFQLRHSLETPKHVAQPLSYLLIRYVLGRHSRRIIHARVLKAPSGAQLQRLYSLLQETGSYMNTGQPALL